MEKAQKEVVIGGDEEEVSIKRTRKAISGNNVEKLMSRKYKKCETRNANCHSRNSHDSF